MKNYNINPYIPMGNWGTYHKKACKGGNPPERGEGTTERCDCGSGDSSLSSAQLYLNNNTIKAGIGGLEAIATIKATNKGGSEHDGPIKKITQTTLSKAGSTQLTIETKLQAGDILNLSGTAPATSGDETKIEGTIIVTKAGSLGETITLTGRLAGTLKLNNGTSNTITVTNSDSLNANTPSALAGINVTGGSGSLGGTATMEITSNNPAHDLTTITGPVTINNIKLTKDDGALTTDTSLANSDTLNLEGTATAGGIAGDLTVTGKITITSGTSGNLLSPLTFTGDVTSSLQFQNAEDGSGVTVQSGTLTLPATTLTVLKNTNFSLTSDDNRALTSKSDLVTKNKITLGTISNTSGQVKLSGLSIVHACITGTGNFKATANLSLSLTHTEATGTLTTTEGLTISLAGIANTNLTGATVTITKDTKDTVKSLPGDQQLRTNTDLKPGDTLTLNITGSRGTTLTGKITVTKPGNLTGNLDIRGGLIASGVSLGGSGTGNLTASDVSITSLKYDPKEFHVNDQNDICVLVPLKYI
ncbi:uncharacterized protein TA09280 [Theileria annulata]|uniref:Uncharacterized protein n=1 Tax=Theileria annulata TaxID=5874 RepID=Q4UAF1_THEAN|nr:uncharacterized protein TA09280 [Theileria annulata]CAI76200.1 hypothetical protein, conserved [Theileria annulata]|eukprot:XP_952825.1 hypothetical protein, conserved [Theileria annulata]